MANSKHSEIEKSLRQILDNPSDDDITKLNDFIVRHSRMKCSDEMSESEIQQLYDFDPQECLRCIYDELRDVGAYATPTVVADKRDVFKRIEDPQNNVSDKISSLNLDFPSSSDIDPLDEPFTEDEISQALEHFKGRIRSKPGLDGVLYSDLMKVPRDILRKFFNHCREKCVIPSAWHSSETKLIPKDDPDGQWPPRKWRPITKVSCFYKVFARLVLERLKAWNKELLCPEQCLFSGGVITAVFTARSVLETCLNNEGNVAIAFLDIQQAFDSVPHEVVLDVMRRLGLKSDKRSWRIVEKILTGNKTYIKTNKGSMESISFKRGIRQGCPLSHFFFACALDLLLRASKQPPGDPIPRFEGDPDGFPISAIAYVDDIALFANDPEALQGLLDRVARAADCAGLEFNRDKCRSLWIKEGKAAPSDLQLNGDRIAPVEKGGQTYLGIRLGETLIEKGEKIKNLCAKVEKVSESMLRTEQKVDALINHLYIALVYRLRHSLLSEKHLNGLEESFKNAFSSIQNLETYLPKGFISVRDRLAIVRMEDAVHFLNSEYSSVCQIARKTLATIMAKETGKDNPSFEDQIQWLNEVEDNIRYPKKPFTWWATVRWALSHLRRSCSIRISFQIEEDEKVSLKIVVPPNKRHYVSIILEELVPLQSSTR